jgi:anaerobic magnesium-protoporphyrin IX monomethyl ester cyclase
MRVMLIPPRSNYPYTGICLDHMPQSFPYLAAVLRSAEHSVSGVNLNFENNPNILKRLSDAVEKYQPQVIGVGGLSADYLFVRDTIRQIRRINIDIPIILGGGLITADAKFIFHQLEPDVAVIGEGEKTILELIGCLERNDDLNDVKGIAFRKNGKLCFTKPRALIDNLDEIPFPDYSPFDIETYLNLVNQNDNYFHARTRIDPRLLPISGARGCPFQCTFCWHATGRRYRKRSINSIIDEIGHMYDLYHPNIYKLYDEIFSTDEHRVRELCQKIKDIKLDFDWSCSMRVCDVNPSLLKEMKSAGCIHIGYGFESASQSVLESMGKHILVEQIRNAIEWTEQAGIGVQGNFIFGDTSETADSIRETWDFYLKHCTKHIVHLDYITAYPGSTIFKNGLTDGVISNKLWYYENIHTRPRINMTNLPYEEFRGLIEPIVSSIFTDIETVDLFRHEISVSNDFDPKRMNHSIQLICPHCERKVNYLLPLENSERKILFCSKCHRRFSVDLSSYSKE